MYIKQNISLTLTWLFYHPLIIIKPGTSNIKWWNLLLYVEDLILAADNLIVKVKNWRADLKERLPEINLVTRENCIVWSLRNGCITWNNCTPFSRFPNDYDLAVIRHKLCIQSASSRVNWIHCHALNDPGWLLHHGSTGSKQFSDLMNACIHLTDCRHLLPETFISETFFWNCVLVYHQQFHYLFAVDTWHQSIYNI